MPQARCAPAKLGMLETSECLTRPCLRREPQQQCCLMSLQPWRVPGTPGMAQLCWTVVRSEARDVSLASTCGR